MMMMNKTASTSQLGPKTENRQFFQWAVKWFYANASETVSVSYLVLLFNQKMFNCTIRMFYFN